MHAIRYLLALSLALVVSSCDTPGSAQNSGPNLPVRDSAPDGPAPQIAGGTNLPGDNHGGSVDAFVYRIDSRAAHLAAYPAQRPETMRALSRGSQAYLIAFVEPRGKMDSDSFLEWVDRVTYNVSFSRCWSRSRESSMQQHGEWSMEIHDPFVFIYFYYS